MLGKNTILKAIHNIIPNRNQSGKVWMLGKNTILKAIHNFNLTGFTPLQGVNAG